MSKVSGSYKTKTENVPPLSSLPASAKRGYLWKLSGRSLLHKTNWKRKFFVLWEGRLFYYQDETDDPRGCGVLQLKYFTSCVEAPLRDHKKATNVFILLASERGFLDQGRCYLSAETLGEMKDWVSKLKMALDNLHRSRHSVPDIPEEKCGKSASLSSLPSQKSDAQDKLREPILPISPIAPATEKLNRSADDRVSYEMSLDRTYQYSSSDDSLNQSFSFVPSVRNSVYSCMQRRSLNTGSRRSSGQFNSLPKPDPAHRSNHLATADQFNSLPKPGAYSTPADKLGSEAVYRNSPSNSNNSSRKQLKFAEESMSDRKSLNGSNLSIDTLTTTQSQLGVKMLNNNGPSEDVERKLVILSKQLDELKRLFRDLDAETSSNRRDVGSVHEALATMNTTANGIEERISRFQSYMTNLERQAGTIMMEIRATQDRVLRTLEEAERARREYSNLKQKTEFLLLQLQGDAVAMNLPSQQLAQPTIFKFGSQEQSQHGNHENNFNAGGQQLFLAGHQGGNSLFATHNNQPSSTSNLFNSSCHQNQPGNNSLFYTAANAGTGSTNQLFQTGQATPQLNSKMIKSSRAVVSDNIPSRGESIGAGNNNACHNNRRDKRDGKGSVQFCQDPNHHSSEGPRPQDSTNN